MPAIASVTPARRSSRQPDRRWLSQLEAADFLGVTDRTVRNYIARGYLPASRVKGSRLVRIRRDDLDKLLRPIPSGGGQHAR